jgi:hypothetical protein
VPSNIQGIAGLATSISEVVNDVGIKSIDKPAGAAK